ncbi:MAG: nucleoside diphosphate kinase regulator [Alphaproteobacteria bacterium]
MRTLQKPSITLLAADHDRLASLANAAMYNDPETAEMLAEELERARIINKGQAPKDIVRMGSDVLFRDDATKEVRRVTLVFPGEADIAQNKVSVLTPIGTALIGLRTGQSITWRTRSGQFKRLTVLKVMEPPDCTSDA